MSKIQMYLMKSVINSIYLSNVGTLVVAKLPLMERTGWWSNFN